MSLTLQLLNCNACGGPLDVAPSANFVSCGHCGCRLAIHRTGTAAFTEVLERIENKVDVTARRVAEIGYRDQLDRIDREWEDTRKGLLGTDADAGLEPDPDFDRSLRSVLIVAGALTCLGGVLVGVLLSGTRDFEETLLPIAAVLVGVGALLMGLGWWKLDDRVSTGVQFYKLRSAYLKRRSAVPIEQFLPVPPGPKAAG